MIAYDETESARLIRDLRGDPTSFRKRQSGGALDLLTQFHRGLPLRHLHELLAINNDDLLSSAVFIMSELASGVEEFVDEAIRLSDHADPRIRHATDEVLVRATSKTRYGEFMHVMKHVEDLHPFNRKLAICYFAKATSHQLSCAAAAWEHSGAIKARTHINAVRLALADPCVETETLADMISGQDRLETYYGLGIAARNLWTAPNCARLLTGLEDAELSQVAASLVDWVRPRERRSARQPKV